MPSMLPAAAKASSTSLRPDMEGSAPTDPHPTADTASSRRVVAAVVFDLDGTLVDTEPLSRRAWDETLAPFGHRLADSDWLAIEGRSFSAARDHFAAFLDLPDSARLWKLYMPRLEPLLRDRLETFADGAEAVRALRAAQVRLALATTSRRERAAVSLQSSGLAGCFEVVVYGDDLARTKPAPDPYLRAAELLGVRPEVCVAVEDSPVGVRSARAAGMRVIAVRRHGGEDLGDADAVVERLSAGAILAVGAQPPEPGGWTSKCTSSP